MAAIDQISFGKVFTHLATRFDGATTALRSGARPAQIAEDLKDPIYQSLVSDDWVAPVRTCRQMAQARAAAEQFLAELDGRPADARDLRAFPQKTLEKLNASVTSEWSPNSYLIVPVIANENTPGLVYLRGVPIESGPGVRRHLHIENLTRDPRLLGYFDSLAAVLLKRFYLVDRYPFDSYTHLSDVAYRLMFDSQIDEGQSVGAAALAMFCIAFLRRKLGGRFKEVAAPTPGTLVTGIVDAEGSVRRVDDIEKKIRCALDEYGPELKIIAPRDNHELDQIEGDVADGHLFRVSTVDQLLTALLDSPADIRGLDATREAVFLGLTSAEKLELMQGLSTGVPPTIYDHPHNWAEPVAHEEGIYSISQFCENRLDVHVATTTSGLATGDSAHAGRRLIELFLDGTAWMDPHWSVDPRLGTSRIAAAVFQVLMRLDNAREDLVVGFLSSERQLPIAAGTPAAEIHALVVPVRDQEKLRVRAAIFTPAREKSLAVYGGRQRRAYLISDSLVPDWQDVKDHESVEQLRLSADSTAPADAHALFLEDGTVNRALFDVRFDQTTVTVTTLSVAIGYHVPVDFEPAGEQSYTEQGMVIHWSASDVRAWHVRLRLASRVPRQVTVSGTVVRSGERREFSFHASPTRTQLPPLDQTIRGQLTDKAFAIWKTICDSNLPCPDPACGKHHVHLVHEPDMQLSGHLLFDVPEPRGRWFLLPKGRREWTLFRTGCQVDGVTITLVNRVLHYAEEDGRLQIVPADSEEEGLYRLDLPRQTLFLATV